VSNSLNESTQTLKNLKLLKSDDIEKLMQMDKSEIIKYYEGLLDKCHEVIIKKRDQNRTLRESKLSLQFNISRVQRQNNEL